MGSINNRKIIRPLQRNYFFFLPFPVLWLDSSGSVLYFVLQIYLYMYISFLLIYLLHRRKTKSHSDPITIHSLQPHSLFIRSRWVCIKQSYARNARASLYAFLCIHLCIHVERTHTVSEYLRMQKDSKFTFLFLCCILHVWLFSKEKVLEEFRIPR